MTFKRNSIIDGNNYNFNYETDQALNIETESTMHISNGTFNYDTATNNLVTPADSSSIIHLNQATWLATQACTITNGSMQTTGPITLVGDATLDLSGLNSLDVYGGIIRLGTVIL